MEGMRWTIGKKISHLESKMETTWNSTRSLLGVKWLICALYLLCMCSGLNAKEIQGNNLSNPFKKVDKFTVFIISTLPQGEEVIKGFEKIGSVKRFSTIEKKGIDFTGFSECSLFFSVTPMPVLNEEKTDLFQLQLSFSTNVEILNTKNRIITDVWHKIIITRKENIDHALRKLVEQFAQEYTKANPQIKPAFSIYL